MKMVLVSVLIFVSFGCVADSCAISEEDVKNLSAMYRENFIFNIVQGAPGNVTVEVSLPVVINEQKFDSLYLIGMSSQSNRPYWGIPVATFPVKSDKLRLSTEIFVPENFLENAWLSITYGSGSCLPYVLYEIQTLRGK